MSSAPLMLSVSGARGIVGESMTGEVAAQFALAFARFTKEQTNAAHPRICIGRDSRPSGEMLMQAAMTALSSAGCEVIDFGVVATPTVGVMIEQRGAQGGLVITASHNPGQWNGLKALDHTGAAPSAASAARIIELFKIAIVDSGELNGNSTAHANRDDTANQIHIDRILSAIDPKPIRAARLKVVLDSVNGAGCVVGRMLLESLGCEIIQINGEPNGEFAHAPEPLKENLTELAQRTRTEGAACGFAQDPDADRLAVIDETGRYIGEEYTLVLAAAYALTTGAGGPLAANLSTSRMIDDLAAQHETAVLRSAVGEANVVALMREHGAVIGGEGNGGVIWPRVCWVRDSLSAMALVLGLLTARNKPLSRIVDDMPSYSIVKEKVELGQVDVAVAAARIQEKFAAERINASDGVRIDFTGEENGWVHLRPSNTEPIVRIIAEARTASRARELIQSVRECAGL